MAETHPSFAYYQYIDVQETVTGTQQNVTQNALHHSVNVTLDSTNIFQPQVRRKY